MEQNNLDNPNRFYTLATIWSLLLSISALVVGIIVGLATNRFDVTFAFVLNLIFPTLGVFISKVFNDLIFKFAKLSKRRKQIIVFSITLFILKYIVIVLPLIIGLMINLTTGATIFNPFALVVGVLIYPSTTLIVQ